MPAPRILRSRQPRAEHEGSATPAEASVDIENRDPNAPFTIDGTPIKDINFSRKRPLTAIRTSDEASTETPKRQRSTQQLNTDDVQTPPIVHTLRAQRKHASPSASLSRRHASNPARDSRFKEASMHDRISEKPPSMFTRIFNSTNDHGVTDVDQLMEDYHNSTDSPVRLRPVTRHGRNLRPVTRQTQLAGLTHHANASISATSTATPQTGATKDSGIYRFGRSIASAFNPFKAWKSVQRGLKETEEELIRESIKKAEEAEAAERKVQIEAAYQELKRSGKIPMKTVVRPVTSMGTRPGDRDSGIQLSSTRSSAELRTSFYDDEDIDTPGRPQSRKSAFQVRRPSLHDLKNLPSSINFKHARLSSLSTSPEKSFEAKEEYAQASVSKKNLAKQQKLCKQVSDLEARLEKAKTELQHTRTEAKPLPRLPTQPEATPKKIKTPHKAFSITKKARISMHLPALESIPSERFLLRTGLVENTSDLSFRCQGDAQQQQAFEPELDAVDEKRLSTSEHSFLDDESDDGEAVEATPKAPRNNGLMTDLAVAQMAMLNTPPPGSKDSSQRTEVVESPVLGSPAKQKRTTNKRKAKDDNSKYRHTLDSADDEAEWVQTHNASLANKKRNTGAPSITRSKALALSSHPPEQTDLDSSLAARASSVDLIPEAADDVFSSGSNIMSLSRNRPLSIVAEETASIKDSSSITASIAVKLNEEPVKSTAVKTPAAYPSRIPHSRSHSPDKSPNRRRRSQSPPPSSAYSARTPVRDETVSVRPDGKGVPPMPRSSPTREPGSPFQWPEDCF